MEKYFSSQQVYTDAIVYIIGMLLAFHLQKEIIFYIFLALIFVNVWFYFHYEND
jgi:hypothetical protein